MAVTAIDQPTFGELLRSWRTHRRLSQLDLSTRAVASTRHLSCLETGRARPSREMVLHLADQLEVPLRERNRLLVAAGFAPVYRESELDDLGPVRVAIDRILAAQDPYPAVVVDRQWNLVAANEGLGLFAELVSPELLVPPANVVRASLHPAGLAPRVRNFADYAGHLVGRIRRDADVSGDPALSALLDEVIGFPGVPAPSAVAAPDWGGALLALQLSTPRGELSFFSTIATFGTPTDVTLDELSIELFFPADDATATALGGR